MTLSLVSLMAGNVDEAAADLAGHLTAQGINTEFADHPHADRVRRVESGEADILWVCGWQALEVSGGANDLVAAPSFIGERSRSYRSVIVSRAPAASLAGLVATDPLWAMNEPSSWSGHWVVRAECDLRQLPAPSRLVWSGSHLDSMRMLVEGAADAAAIDSTVWRWAGLDDLTVVDVSRDWPAPPLLVRNELAQKRTVADLIAGATGLRGLEAVESANWSHLDPMRAWTRP